MHRARRVARWRAVAGLLAVVTVPGALLVAPARAGATGLSYVALGDSYASGPFIPSQQDTTPGCLRSNENYPHVLAAALGADLTDVSCSGATTADLTGWETTSDGRVPPQLDALSKATRLVTLTIGGDDLGFVSIVKNCLAATPWGPTPSGKTCMSHYDAHGVDQLAAAVASLEPKIAATLQAIHTRAPGAQVLVVGYPDLIPPAGAGCWPNLPFTHPDASYLRGVETDLNSMLSAEAAGNGATYVDTYAASGRYSACSPSAVRWVEPIIPTAPAAPLHPDAAGEAGMARIIEGVLGSHWT